MKNTVVPILAWIWATGILVFGIYTIISYQRLRSRMKTAVPLRDNIYQSENVASPFVLGLLHPRIYLPFNIAENDMAHVIAHEQAHIKRHDHWIKPFGFLILSLYWFNPILWVAYVLLCRDIELACDERVIKELETEQRADYSQALLTCSIPRHQIAACPLAFGEVGVKERVKNVLNYKKPASWIVVVALLSCIVVAICFLTSPKNTNSYENYLLTFPVSDSEKTEYNEGIFEIEPFNIKIPLPNGWSIGEYSDTAGHYLYSGMWSRVGVYDENNSLVGAIGYNICDDGASLEEPMSVYHQISLGNDYQFNVHDTYEIATKSDTFETATVEVYHSRVLDPAAEADTINYGIVACHPGRAVYVAIELDSNKITETQTGYIASNIEFPKRFA